MIIKKSKYKIKRYVSKSVDGVLIPQHITLEDKVLVYLVRDDDGQVISKVYIPLEKWENMTNATDIDIDSFALEIANNKTNIYKGIEVT